jgi:hypothetical protein
MQLSCVNCETRAKSKSSVQRPIYLGIIIAERTGEKVHPVHGLCLTCGYEIE